MKKLGKNGFCVVAVLMYAVGAFIAGSFAVDAFSGNLTAPASQTQQVVNGNTSYLTR